MNTLLFLICYPLVAALALSLVRHDGVRRAIVIASALALIIGSLGLLRDFDFAHLRLYALDADWVRPAMQIIELGLAGYMLAMALRHKKWLIVPLVLAQAGLGLWFEFAHVHGMGKGSPLFIDQLSLIMALIIGIVGSLIAVYALGYMKSFHAHEAHGSEAVPDKRRSFFFIIFVFLSAMFGVVFSNDLLWFYFFWEITTICSFVMIGYRGNQESIDNSFLALGLNLLGGLAMLLGIVVLFLQQGVFEWNELLMRDKFLVMAPVMLLSIAGIVKAAQLPFSSWLLGAMVAPTPVSALLHSSTMVKAGVYLLVKLGPVLTNTYAGLLISLIGGFTFLMTSLIAIAQRDAKKVLAYSTIANLGLIVMCAGIGSYEAIWAAVLLIIFHAVAKCLLFLCVGSVEHTLGSREIEDMDGLIVSMPRLAWLMLIGMAGMFLAPFGMLISKWAALVAVIDANPILSFLLLYGSAATLFFWVKWMGKLLCVSQPKGNVETGISRTVWTPLFILGGLMMAVCLFFPYISHAMIEPYVISIYGMSATMSRGNIIIMIIMIGMVFLFPFSLPNKSAELKAAKRMVDAYMGGANIPGRMRFTGSAGTVRKVAFQNYYLDKYFGEKVLFYPSVFIALGLLIVLMIGAAS
ncbi:MAG: proton-conducting transporter membrane subunit [Deltaproteobacteria bacterium]|nr:proton-conducting transporter membrane subunit [Deltaproteobacteria bacterium]